MKNFDRLLSLEEYISYAHVVLDELAAEWRKLHIENSKDFPMEMLAWAWNEEFISKLEE